jgi:hypothetical protein
MSSDPASKVTPIRPGVQVPSKAPKKKGAKAYRSGADWETLEYYYRIGWSLRDIAALPEAKGITSQAISNRISRYKWTRNLEPRVADVARAMMMGDLDGKSTTEKLGMLRGSKQKEDEVVLTSAAEIAERLKKIRTRTKNLDSLIDQNIEMIAFELTMLAEQAADPTLDPLQRSGLRVELGRLTKALNQLTATVAKANAEEHNNRDLSRVMKPQEAIKPMLVKKRAVLDGEDVNPDD